MLGTENMIIAREDWAKRNLAKNIQTLKNKYSHNVAEECNFYLEQLPPEERKAYVNILERLSTRS